MPYSHLTLQERYVIYHLVLVNSTCKCTPSISGFRVYGIAPHCTNLLSPADINNHQTRFSGIAMSCEKDEDRMTRGAEILDQLYEYFSRQKDLKTQKGR